MFLFDDFQRAKKNFCDGISTPMRECGKNPLISTVDSSPGASLSHSRDDLIGHNDATLRDSRSSVGCWMTQRATLGRDLTEIELISGRLMSRSIMRCVTMKCPLLGSLTAMTPGLDADGSGTVGVPGCCGTVALDGFLCWLEEFQQKEYRLRRDSYPSFCFNNLLLTNCATLAQETKRIFAIFLVKFKFHKSKINIPKKAMKP